MIQNADSQPPEMQKTVYRQYRAVSPRHVGHQVNLPASTSLSLKAREEPPGSKQPTKTEDGPHRQAVCTHALPHTGARP